MTVPSVGGRQGSAATQGNSHARGGSTVRTGNSNRQQQIIGGGDILTVTNTLVKDLVLGTNTTNVTPTEDATYDIIDAC